MTVTVDTKEIEKFYNKLEDIKRTAIPFAVRNALNDTAFRARKLWIHKIKKQMVLKNTYTTSGRNIRVEKAKGLKVNSMESIVGAIESYMAMQETGGVETKKGKHGVSIQTSVATGEGRGAKRRRTVRGVNKMARIILAKRHGNSPRQRNAVAIKQAAKKGHKHVFLELNDDRAGLFKIQMKSRNVKGTRNKISGLKEKVVGRLDMVWDLSRSSVRVPRNPTLGPTVDAMNKVAPRLYITRLKEQIRRHSSG